MKISMMNMMILLFAVQLVTTCLADLYMHNPPGSNDRNREENANRNNANRLFDSQNNANGGYPWRGDPNVQGAPDELTYYPDSLLRIEWTQQHGCGPNGNVECDLVIQYACEDTMPHLRDGYPVGPLEEQNGNDGYTRATFLSADNPAGSNQNQAGTNQIPMPQVDGSSGQRFEADNENFGTSQADGGPTPEILQRNIDTFYSGGQIGNYYGVEYGMHEHYNEYKKCIGTERNKGLYIADRNLGGNSARFTRQNNGGTRRGFECPEERDYYPYWRPTVWKDVAVLTSNLDFCERYQSESQNVKSRWECVMPAGSEDLAPLSENACSSKNGAWREVAAWNLPEPECLEHMTTRDNHLGNVINDEGSPTTAFYTWRLPKEETVLGKKCIVRLRYNMSASNYDSHADYKEVSSDEEDTAKMVDKSLNCQGETGDGGVNQCSSRLDIRGIRPLYDNPYSKVWADLPEMALAINTNQIGRTFQDRSHVFSIKSELAEDVAGDVWNLNVRGRRGNIVQAYPAVEYDFVPSFMHITTNDAVHVQIHGSDFNPNNVAGEGTAGTDRSNLVQMDTAEMDNFPLHGSFQNEDNRMMSEEDARALLMVGQEKGQCTKYDDDDNADNEVDNCGKLNAAPNTYRHPNLLTFENEGEFHAISTRNNNFSNRSQKFRLFVKTGWLILSPAVIAAIVVAVLAVLSLAGVAIYARMRPESAMGKSFHGLFSRGAPKASAGKPGVVQHNLDLQQKQPVLAQDYEQFTSPRTSQGDQI